MRQALRSYPLAALASAVLAAFMVSGCVQGETVTNGGVVLGNGLAPPGAPPGSCWGKIPTAAVIETITEQVLVTPARTNPDGTIAALPVYREERRQQIVTARTDRWFEIPCPPDFTVEFVSTLQRALQVRGLYDGDVSGNMDDSTRRAVLAVQSANGLPSDVLSIETARELGIVAVPREP